MAASFAVKEKESKRNPHPCCCDWRRNRSGCCKTFCAEENDTGYQTIVEKGKEVLPQLLGNFLADRSSIFTAVFIRRDDRYFKDRQK